MTGILADGKRQDRPGWRTRCSRSATLRPRSSFPARIANSSLPATCSPGSADVGTDHDEELVDALRLRAPTAAERLIARYGGRAYHLAVRITGNAADAEEVVQDAILSVVRKIDTFRGESAFGSWFYRVVSNAAYGRRRPRAWMEIALEEVLPAFDEHGRYASLFRDWSSGIDDPAVQRQLRDVLTSAIDELPPHYRAAIVLRDVEGLSTAEVAGALGITISTAKS